MEGRGGVGCDDAARGRRFEGMRNGRRREEEGEGVKAKTERVGEIRDLRTDRRTLLCSHRGVRERRRFYAKLCKLRSSVTRAARAGGGARTSMCWHARTHNARTRRRKSIPGKHASAREMRSAAGEAALLRGFGCLRREHQNKTKQKNPRFFFFFLESLTCMETLLKDPPMTPAIASGLSSCRA